MNFQDSGEQELKNIARPVQVYQLRPDTPLTASILPRVLRKPCRVTRREPGCASPRLHPHPKRLSTERPVVLKHNHVVAPALDRFKRDDQFRERSDTPVHRPKPVTRK